MRERNQLHGASGQATAINTERHINDGKVTTYPIKKEGTPKLHPYLPAIGNTEAGVFPFALLATLPSHLQLFPSAKYGLGWFCLILLRVLWAPPAAKLICRAATPQSPLLGKRKGTSLPCDCI